MSSNPKPTPPSPQPRPQPEVKDQTAERLRALGHTRADLLAFLLDGRR